MTTTRTRTLYHEIAEAFRDRKHIQRCVDRGTFITVEGAGLHLDGWTAAVHMADGSVVISTYPHHRHGLVDLLNAVCEVYGLGRPLVATTDPDDGSAVITYHAVETAIPDTTIIGPLGALAIELKHKETNE